jgi:L-alanine-DL-glutamate epimerase-like enolase superfamily enzyme
VPFRRHRDVAALSKYSRDNNKLYPLHLAKTTCMKFLLREFESVPGYVWDDWKRELVPKSEREREGMIRSGAYPGWSVTRNERSEIVRGQW